MNVQFTAVFIVALVGTLMTLFFAYVPNVRVWFALLALEKQALLKLGVSAVIAIVIFGLSYTSIFPPPINAITLLVVLGSLIVTNQPLASLLPATKDVRAAIRVRTKKFMAEK
jgi:hypothetical protein